MRLTRKDRGDRDKRKPLTEAMRMIATSIKKKERNKITVNAYAILGHSSNGGNIHTEGANPAKRFHFPLQAMPAHGVKRFSNPS